MKVADVPHQTVRFWYGTFSTQIHTVHQSTIPVLSQTACIYRTAIPD